MLLCEESQSLKCAYYLILIYGIQENAKLEIITKTVIARGSGEERMKNRISEAQGIV